MQLHSLLLCKQPETAALVAQVCRELGVELEHCREGQLALEKLAAHKFHAVIIDDIDDQDAPSAIQLLNSVKGSATVGKTLGIVLAATHTTLNAAFEAGTHLVIYKPLTHDRLRSSLRAICTLMGKRHQRQSRRVKVDVPGTLTVNESEDIPTSISDISRGGAAVFVERSIPPVKSLQVSFTLPGTPAAISTSAELIWQDVHGRAGIRFLNLSPMAKQVYRSG